MRLVWRLGWLAPTSRQHRPPQARVLAAAVRASHPTWRHVMSAVTTSSRVAPPPPRLRRPRRAPAPEPMPRAPELAPELRWQRPKDDEVVGGNPSAPSGTLSAPSMLTCGPVGRRALVASAAAAAFAAWPGAAALAATNEAVLAALKRKEEADLVEGGAVSTRLNVALDELRRAQQLATVGEYDNARQLLRRGALASVRTDLEKVAGGGMTLCVTKQRPSSMRP